MLQEDGSPPFVKFEQRAVPDINASKKVGYHVSKDVDFIVLIPRGSGGKLTVDEPYARWLNGIKNTPFRNEVRTGDSRTPMSSARFPDSWLQAIQEKYEAWKSGQTLPEKGTPIAQWGVPTPSERERMIHLHYFTVEQLAEATDEGIGNFGMGGVRLRQLARDYLATTKNDGNKLAAELAELRAQNESLSRQVQALHSRLEKAGQSGDSHPDIAVSRSED